MQVEVAVVGIGGMVEADVTELSQSDNLRLAVRASAFCLRNTVLVVKHHDVNDSPCQVALAGEEPQLAWYRTLLNTESVQKITGTEEKAKLLMRSLPACNSLIALRAISKMKWLSCIKSSRECNRSDTVRPHLPHSPHFVTRSSWLHPARSACIA